MTIPRVGPGNFAWRKPRGVWNGAHAREARPFDAVRKPRPAHGAEHPFPRIRGARPPDPSGVSWIVFAGRDAPWPDGDPGVEVCRGFPSNERPLLAAHGRPPGVGPGGAPARRQRAPDRGFLPAARRRPTRRDARRRGGPRAGRGRHPPAYRRWAVGRGLGRAALVIANSSWTRSRLGPGAAPVIVSPEGLRHDLFGPGGPARGAGRPRPVPPVGLQSLPLQARRARARRLRPPGAGEALRVSAGGRRRRLGRAARAGGGGRAQARDSRGRPVPGLGGGRGPSVPLPGRARACPFDRRRSPSGAACWRRWPAAARAWSQDLPVLREVAGECAVYVDYADTRRRLGGPRAHLRGRRRPGAAERERESSGPCSTASSGSPGSGSARSWRAEGKAAP